MLQFLENLLLKRRLRKRPEFELQYFEKYKNLVAWDKIVSLLEEYKSGDIIFEPIRLKITEQDEEVLYENIDKSEILSPLEKIFGKEFVEMIEKKREEFKDDIATKKLIRLTKEWKKYTGLKKESPFAKKFIGTNFDPLTKKAREHLKIINNYEYKLGRIRKISTIIFICY